MEEHDLVDADYGYDYDDYELLPHYENYGELTYNPENMAEIINYRVENFDFIQEATRLVTGCMGTVVIQAFDQSKLIFLLCFMLRIITFYLNYFKFGSWMICIFVHSLVSTLGVLVIHSVFNEILFPTLYIVGALILITYLSNWVCSKIRQANGGVITTLITVLYIILSEIFSSNPSMWHRIRGLLLLMSMKIISVSIDFRTCKINGGLPNFLEYLGYCLHPGTLIFGPWVSLQEYRLSLFAERRMNLEWLFCVIKSCVQCTLCLVLSMCVMPYLVLDPIEIQMPILFPFVGNNWMISYKNALSFHFSHYYVGYLATAISLISGIGAVKLEQKKVKIDEDESETTGNIMSYPYTWSKFGITKPLSILIPRSMLNVVVAWNIPMSKWLKSYVFDTSRFLGNFPAILFTYAASALLHGLSFHLAAVLFSLGFYTYTEHSLRLKLSNIFHCPAIRARPKKVSADAEARLSPVPFWAKVFNFVWILINIMHLAYLGSMFHSEDDDMQTEGYSMGYTIGKWSRLSFFSHWFALACFLINCII